MKYFRILMEQDGLGGGSDEGMDLSEAQANGFNPYLDQYGNDLDYETAVSNATNWTGKDGRKINMKKFPTKEMWGAGRNQAKASSAGTPAFNTSVSADQDVSMALLDRPEMLQAVSQRDFLANLYGKTKDEAQRKRIEQQLKLVEENIQNLNKKYQAEIGNLGKIDMDVGKRDQYLEPGWWKKYEADSNQVQDYFKDNMANTWKNIGDKDRKILLWDQVGTMLKNAGKYRPKLYGAFGNVVDEGQNAGEEKSMLQNTLESNLKAGLDRSNTRMKTTMMNALENANAGADEIKMVQRGLDEGWLNRSNASRLISMLQNMPRQTLKDLKEILTSFASHSYGLSTPWGGVNYTSPDTSGALTSMMK